LEGDLIIGTYNRSAIVGVFDRTSCHLWLADCPEDHGAEATLAALSEILGRIPEQLRRTLTWDQECGMACDQELAALCGIDVYFCARTLPGSGRRMRAATSSCSVTSARAPTCPARAPPNCESSSTASTRYPGTVSAGQPLIRSKLQLS